MKRFYLLVFICCSSLVALAQPYENSWINYNQQYFKVKVWKDGIYRISRQNMILSGIPVGSIDPRKISIYHNGQEEYIYVEGEGDGAFDTNDFIEFYGHKNDGRPDSSLYEDNNWQANLNYSLFTDTAIYFVTWSAITNGRRVTNPNDSSYAANPLIAPYFIKESYNEQTFGYNRGMNDKSIQYTESEAWCGVFGNYARGNYPLTIPINTANIYTAGPDLEINTAIGGVNNNPHNISFTFPGTNYADLYFQQTLKKYHFTALTSIVTGPTTNFVYNSTSSIAITDYSAYYNLSVKYPHTYDLEAASTFTLYVPDEPIQGKAHMSITNFNAGASAPIMYDLTNHVRILVTPNGSTFDALVGDDGSGVNKTCFISAVSQITDITSLTGINYNPSNFGQFNNFLLAAIDSAYIIITHKTLWSEASSYKTYRDGTTGNKVLLIDVEELYDQFAWGIQKDPLSIKHFAHFILDNWTTVAPPQHMFLIGKSISPGDFRTSSSLWSQCLVPSYGVPTSDQVLTAGINGSLYEPKIPIGRLCARKGLDVTNYLHKVTEYEAAQATTTPEPWMKEILHFGGGDDQSQQQQLAAYLDMYKAVLEDSFYGGHVTTYLKFSSDPIQINSSDSLQAKINNGVSLMTFFGHASGSGFDISTDEPGNYNNHGKYPLVMANSCFAGDIHTSSVSVSEKFVMEPEKAAIGFIASVGQGVPGDLFNYTNAFFQHASYTDYGASIGTLMKKAIEDIQIPNAENIKIVCEEMSLHGDPALKLNNFSKPDYYTDESNIHFSPTSVTTDLDSFSVNITTRNLGKAVQDSFYVKLTRTYPNNVDSVYSFKRGRCYYEDNFSVMLSVGGFNSAGVNRFKVEVDLPDSVHEYVDYLNNESTNVLFITSKDIIPVYPPKYAIHPYSTVTLKASTANPMIGMNTYRFEIDTVDLSIPGAQASSMYRFSTVNDSGGVLSWAPQAYNLVDSMVYFWRVANDSIQVDTVHYKWQESSFIYIPGKTGWAQSHFHQFKSDSYHSVRYDTTNRQFAFVQNNKSLRVMTVGLPNGTQTQYNLIGYYLNNAPIEYNGCLTTPAVMIAVLDSVTLEPWNTCAYTIGQANTFTASPPGQDCSQPGVTGIGTCRFRPENYFIYRYNNPGQLASIDSLINAVPDGDYIIAYSWYTTAYSTYPSFLTAFNNLGFDMNLLQDNTPYTLMMKKGSISTKQQVFGQNTGDTLVMTALLSAIWNRGTITTEDLGPASRWESLHWNQTPLENPTVDQIYLNILGLNSSTNAWDTLVLGLQYSATGRDTSLSWISATTYPNIRLQAYTQDDSLRSPSQMKFWRVYYDEVPECALNPSRSFYFYNNPMDEGDTLQMNIAIDNISDLPMDSLQVSFYMYDSQGARHDLDTIKLDSLRIGASLLAGISIDTTFGLNGTNSIWVEANPFISGHQSEQYHFNNIAEVNFKVNRDNINPILDVTFDGIHILNGDIVSGKPTITIQLHDENKYLALNDTNNFHVYIKSPNSTSFQRISFIEPYFGQNMKFTPAQLPKNSCKINWEPLLTEDGTYTLQVEATDKSLNESGRYNYKISFEVINKSTITEVLNYPNPFSTSTRFVFTLTGNETPSHMRIQIMTITGKIVREIMLNELGNIHIGRNITDYAWDGKDAYGDQLANGLYLYRVTTDINGENIEHRDTDADQYFKKGWGKMYLMR